MAFVPRDMIPNTFVTAKSTNPKYWVTIYSTYLGIKVIADLPEQFMFALGSEFNNRLPLSSTSDIAGLREGATAANLNYQSQAASEQIWVGTSPIEIPFTLLFDAQNDAYNDVWRPMTLLETMVMPDLSSTFYQSPEKCSIFASNFYIKEANAISVASTYDTRLDARGYPIAGQSEITFRLSNVQGSKDWLALKGVRKNI